jgi:predicted ATP-grasp superfamily ATP-dependent carboligase
MSVIVTNARNRIAYNVVRSLGRRGLRVYTADSVPRSMSFASRYSKGHFLYASPFRNPQGFIRDLVSQAQRVKAEVLIPVFEETFLIAKYQHLLAPHVSMVVPDYNQILLAHNKDRWAATAHRLGIPVPSSYSPEELQRVGARTLRYPVFIKPKQGGGAWGIKEIGSAEQLETLLAQPTWAGKTWDRFFVQEKIVGRTHCVAMLYARGELRATLGYQQLRDYPVAGGQATMRISVRNEMAESYFKTFLDDICWHGPCQADFIVDDRTGVAYLIDVNPRLWGSLTQAIASGVDFPYLIYRMAKDGDVAPSAPFKTGVVTKWIGGELAALPSRLRQSTSKVDLLRDFFFPKTRTALFDDFSLADPQPFLAWGLDALGKAIRFRTTHPVAHDALDGVWE